MLLFLLGNFEIVSYDVDTTKNGIVVVIIIIIIINKHKLKNEKNVNF